MKINLDLANRFANLHTSPRVTITTKLTTTMTRTKNEIEAALKTARTAYDNHNNVMSEGHDNGNNPHHSTIQGLLAELYAATQAEITAKLSGDSLQAERAWFNAQGFTRPDLAQKACQSRGYNMSDLFAAIKAAK